MYDYKAPLRDIEFVYFEMLDAVEQLKELPQHAELEQDLWTAILGECAKFAENVLAPLNQSGDEEGCTWKDGEVTTPTGFKEAYQQYVEAGWPTISVSEEFGGQGMPFAVNNSLFELSGTANWSWTGFIGFGLAGAETVVAGGSKDLEAKFFPKIYTGNGWAPCA